MQPIVLYRVPKGRPPYPPVTHSIMREFFNLIFRLILTRFALSSDALVLAKCRNPKLAVR